MQSTARAAFSAMKTAAPNAVVVVTYKGRTCNGLRGATNQGSTLTGDGNAGETTGTVRVDASELDMPTRGETLIVGGKTVFILDGARTDAVGALLTIPYSETRPYKWAV